MPIKIQATSIISAEQLENFESYFAVFEKMPIFIVTLGKFLRALKTG